MSTKGRLEKLRETLDKTGLDALLISQPENRQYMSGFSGSAGFLIISKGHAFIATDFRYFEQSQQQAPDYRLLKMQGPKRYAWLEEALFIIRPKRLGFEAEDLTYSVYTRLHKALSEIDASIRPRLHSTRNLVESLRIIKDAAELKEIERAASFADAALARVVPTLEPGMTERQIAWELEKAMRDAGADDISFDTIVASGPNGALPHHQPSDREVREGEFIVIDMGAKVNGYCSDITRTVIIGKPGDKERKIYDTVLAAQLTAINTVESGMSGQVADSLARKIIEEAGHGDNFGHSLGHGIGLQVHESPHVGPRSEDKLTQAMVFTIEPGIYLAGWGGVRIEDMVVLENGHLRVITKTPKALD